MMTYEITDIVFLVNSLKNPSPHFDILTFLVATQE